MSRSPANAKCASISFAFLLARPRAGLLRARSILTEGLRAPQAALSSRHSRMPQRGTSAGLSHVLTHYTLNTNLNLVAALSGRSAAGAPAPGADPAAVFEGVRARLAALGAEAARARGDADALRGQLAAAAERHGAAMADAERRRQARAQRLADCC